ncbi:hypothetical protein VB715_21780 [Crocosphaera sp. UHCC 0190]|uniref:hypothetical protein n=1 Tax=Crocosphaera sp. UHCC 0190 TaxID=3110246 RepID=UPI002B218089|nr:hypothetical protein [Crocosphaera sp. UHCC 0190]MEA5512404.1 hypothetical protein [Crocosphaera sp. UHCC 0190]
MKKKKDFSLVFNPLPSGRGNCQLLKLVSPTGSGKTLTATQTATDLISYQMPETELI